jgi:hypothetical protein
MTSPSETAIEHQMVAEDDADMPEGIPDAVGPLQTEIPQPAAPSWVWQRGATAVDSPAEEPAEEPEVASGEDAEGSMALVVPDAEPEPIPESPVATAVDSPAEPEVASREDAEGSMALVMPDAEPEWVPESPVASAAASLSTRWHEILAMFVDDPRSSAELAAGLVDDSIQTHVASLKEQQDSMLAAWHGEDAGTEELRTAVQHYRAFGNLLADFPREN